MTKKTSRDLLLSFATRLATRIAHRIKTRPELSHLEPEDIEQELITHLLQRIDRFDPLLGNHQAFATRILQTAVATLFRENMRKRSTAPAGLEIETFSRLVDGPDLKSEELICSLTASDGDRRRQVQSRNPIADLELKEAIEHQIRTLPKGYRKIARCLTTSSQSEIATKFNLSKRKLAQAMQVIREHFASVDWKEKSSQREPVNRKGIASTGGRQTVSHCQNTRTEDGQ